MKKLAQNFWFYFYFTFGLKTRSFEFIKVQNYR